MASKMLIALFSLLPSLAMASTAGRWGHQAVYLPSQQSMYIVGGEIMDSIAQVTNDVLILDLSQSNPSFVTGSSDGLPPHAFAASTVTKDGSSIVIAGGMTSSCSSDTITHTFNVTAGSTGWTGASPDRMVRRRGAAAAWVDNGSQGGEVMVVGGISDHYVCASGTYTYPVADVLAVPVTSNGLVSSRALPTTLTGSDLAVSDFALAQASDDTLYMVGGQSTSGQHVPLSTIGRWTPTDGWTSQATTGDVPPGRMGATLVAHPTLDVLILHGGSSSDETSGTVSPSNLLAMLNTTTWAWSTPSNLQPPASSATTYHTSVMTSSGVMITAFGMGPSGTPRSDVFYLDMRDPTGSAWTWKSAWNSNMLNAYTSTVGDSSTSNGVAATTANKAASSAPSHKNEVASITAPIIIGSIILIIGAVFFLRRQRRIAKKRREARHFSFSAQEDDGDFTGETRHVSNTRRTRTPYPFGNDANEKEGTMVSEFVSALKRFSRRMSTDSNASNSGDLSTRRLSRLNEKTMKWEEIDFGLGKVDEGRTRTPVSRISSLSAHRTSETSCDPFGGGSASTHASTAEFLAVGPRDSPRLGTPLHDSQPTLVPDLISMEREESNASETTEKFNPSMEDGLDWNMLAQELNDKPAFRSIDPSSTLRSHSHIEPLQIRRSSTPTQPPPANLNKVGWGMPLAKPHIQRIGGPVGPRAVSQPVGRPLIDQSRRGSAPIPYLPNMPYTGSSRSVTPRSPVINNPDVRRASIAYVGSRSPALPHSASKLRVVNLSDADLGAGAAGLEGGENHGQAL